MRKLIVVKQLSLKYGDELAEILSTDKKLHKELSPNSKLTTINGLEYDKDAQNGRLKREEDVLQ